MLEKFQTLQISDVILNALNEMGFEGLVFTDALAMQGARKVTQPNGLLAFEAGAEVLLEPSTTKRNVDAMVARYAKVFEVKQGEIVGGPYTLKEQRGLYSDSTAHPRHIGITYWEEFYGKDELALFANELKQQIGADTTRLFESGFDYTFLLTTDACGKAHLHLLWPKQLSTAGWEQARRLVEAVEAMPAGGFGHFVTTDGRIFPGRYLKFCYRSKWTVEEYLYQTRKPVNAPRKEPTARRLLNELDRLLYP